MSHHLTLFHFRWLQRARHIAWRVLLFLFIATAPAPAAQSNSSQPNSSQPNSRVMELWQQGQQAQQETRWDDAIRAFSALLEIEPRQINALVALGYSHYKKGELDAAEKSYRQALTLDNYQAAAGFGLGQIAMARRQWKDAVALFRDVLRIAPGYEPVRTRHNLALSLIPLARYDEAATVFEEALQQKEANQYAQLYFDAVNNEITRENYFRAAQWGEAGTRLYPQDAWLWEKLAWALKMGRQRERAREAYTRAETLVYHDVTPQNRTKLSLPFRGRWRVMQGNSNDDSHRGLGARFAWDFAVVDEKGLTHIGSGYNNSDYYSFGQEVLAPASGRVIALENSVPDNAPYQRSASPYSGNYLLIEHAPGEYSSLGHLQQNSIIVKVGQQVQRGEVLARCGNSGRATLPHLHYSFIGIYANKHISLPSQFSQYSVWRDNQWQGMEAGVPEPNSLVQNQPDAP